MSHSFSFLSLLPFPCPSANVATSQLGKSLYLPVSPLPPPQLDGTVPCLPGLVCGPYEIMGGNCPKGAGHRVRACHKAVFISNSLLQSWSPFQIKKVAEPELSDFFPPPNRQGLGLVPPRGSQCRIAARGSTWAAPTCEHVCLRLGRWRLIAFCRSGSLGGLRAAHQASPSTGQ